MCMVVLPLLSSVGNGQKKCSAEGKMFMVMGRNMTQQKKKKPDLILKPVMILHIGKCWIHYFCSPWFKDLRWGGGILFCYFLYYWFSLLLVDWFLYFWCVYVWCVSVCISLCVYTSVCLYVHLCVSVCVPVSGCANLPTCLEIRGQGQDTFSTAFSLVFWASAFHCIWTSLLCWAGWLTRKSLFLSVSVPLALGGHVQTCTAAPDFKVLGTQTLSRCVHRSTLPPGHLPRTQVHSSLTVSPVHPSDIRLQTNAIPSTSVFA